MRRTTTILACLLATVAVVLPASAATGLTTSDLNTVTPTDLANAIAGSGVSVSNVQFTGANVAAGTFAGGTGIIGFESGIVLSSGNVASVVGPNQLDDVTTDNQQPGDADLTALAGVSTHDAAVLQFDFVPTASQVFFQYVFSSDEYNEFVNSSFNDVFAFFVNGTNCAVVGDPAVPVSINTINNGNPFNSDPRSNPGLYRNNDLDDGGGSINTEMDGLTTVLTCKASVTPNATNHMKLAIADGSDFVLDSDVFIEQGSLTTQPATLHVIKHVVNDNSGSASAGDFTLQVTGSNPTPSSFAGAESPGTTVKLAPGSYGVNETGGPAGYSASFSADCSGTIAAGEEKTCTVTNDDIAPTLGTLHVIKHVVNDNSGSASAGDFTLQVTGTSPSPSSFAGAESPGTTVTLSPGSYSVAEMAGGPSGYNASFSADCTGAIAAGEEKTCTVTNDDVAPAPTSGTLHVIKHMVNDNGGSAGAGDFTLQVTGTNPSPSSFAGAESPGTTVTLDAGSYSVAETNGPSGYTSSLSADCVGTIAAGEEKTCTVTNDDVAPTTGTLHVIKHMVNDNGGSAGAGDFTLQVTGTNPSPSSFAGAESPGTSVVLDPGSYSVSELAGGPSGYNASFSADCTGTIAAGEEKTCTVTNDDIAPKPVGLVGCSHGYWKNHLGSWALAGYSPGQTVASVFSGADPVGASTLLDALKFKGGPTVADAKQILLRQAVAALLNAAHPGVAYPLTTAEVIAMVDAALASNDRSTILALAGVLDTDNNLGCPLS